LYRGCIIACSSGGVINLCRNGAVVAALVYEGEGSMTYELGINMALAHQKQQEKPFDYVHGRRIYHERQQFRSSL
jgi:hypothetical protein